MKKIQLKLNWALPRREKRRLDPTIFHKNIPAFGSPITMKEKGILRFAFQNINGILDSRELIGMIELGEMEHLDIDILGMIETNINWDHDARESVLAAARLKFGAARCSMSSSYSMKSGYLPGGVATVARGKVCGRVQQRGSDKWGRFTWTALRGRKDTGVIMVNGYRVCQKAGTEAGEDTAYMRQWVEMREAEIKNPDPRSATLEAISEVLEEWGQKGYHPLVFMDANSKYEARDMEEFISKHGLLDIVRETNPGTPPSTYARGPNRIDLPLGDAFICSAVKRSGALALHDGVKSSDHTMQFIDFDEKILFGDDSFAPIAAYHREFKLYNMKKKHLFQEKLKELYKHQRIPERVQNIAKAYSIRGNLTAEDIQAYQALDAEIVEAIRAAAASVGRKNFGYQQSPALCDAGAAIRMHKAIFSCVRRGTEFTSKIMELAERIKYTLPDRNSISHKAAQRNVSTAWRAKRQIELEDAEYRASWLEELAAERAAESGGKPDKELERMIKAAKTSGVFKRLRSVLKPEWSSLDYIEIPNEKWYLHPNGNELYQFDNGIFVAHGQLEDTIFAPFGTIKVLPDHAKEVDVESTEHAIAVLNPDLIQEATWTKVTKLEEIESWLLRRNKRHLQQMFIEGSPPTTEAFAHIIADYGTSGVADQILNGTYDPSNLELGPEMELFIRQLKQTPEEKRLDCPSQITTKEFQQLFKVQNEDTSSSYSGIHYTLWKAIAEVDSLAEVHALWASLPFMYGFVCDRWKKEIDCMLEKKPGVRKIHILRIIGLMEGDFNAMLKWFYNQKVMPNAESVGMTPNQWGGRKGRSAITCALRKLLTWEYFRYAKETIAAFPGDLQSNFDRMLAPINSIISMKKGMPKSACRCRAAMVESFERPVRTAEGTSIATYKYEEGETRMGGEVQGKPDKCNSGQ
jgi:hypothetical protein